MNDTLLPRPSVSLVFEHFVPSVRLPIVEARRIFEAEHVPRTRQIVDRGLQGAPLVGRHVIGTSFNFIRDQHLHRSWDVPNAVQFFREHFKVDEDLHTFLWEAGKLAAGLEYAWVAAA